MDLSTDHVRHFITNQIAFRLGVTEWHHHLFTNSRRTHRKCRDRIVSDAHSRHPVEVEEMLPHYRKDHLFWICDTAQSIGTRFSYYERNTRLETPSQNNGTGVILSFMKCTTMLHSQPCSIRCPTYCHTEKPVTQTIRHFLDWGNRRLSNITAEPSVLTHAWIVSQRWIFNALQWHARPKYGCVLVQNHPGGAKKPQGFRSRVLIPPKQNYEATRHEFLAVVWAILLLVPGLERHRLTICADYDVLKWILRLPFLYHDWPVKGMVYLNSNLK